MAQKDLHLHVVVVWWPSRFRVNQAADSDRNKTQASKNSQVLEFIGYQETSSGCGLMGLGGKKYSPIEKKKTSGHDAMRCLLRVIPPGNARTSKCIKCCNPSLTLAPPFAHNSSINVNLYDSYLNVILVYWL